MSRLHGSWTHMTSAAALHSPLSIHLLPLDTRIPVIWGWPNFFLACRHFFIYFLGGNRQIFGEFFVTLYHFECLPLFRQIKKPWIWFDNS